MGGGRSVSGADGPLPSRPPPFPPLPLPPPALRASPLDPSVLSGSAALSDEAATLPACEEVAPSLTDLPEPDDVAAGSGALSSGEAAALVGAGASVTGLSRSVDDAAAALFVEVLPPWSERDVLGVLSVMAMIVILVASRVRDGRMDRVTNGIVIWRTYLYRMAGVHVQCPEYSAQTR